MGHGKDREAKTCAGPGGCVVSDGSVTSYCDDGGGNVFHCLSYFGFFVLLISETIMDH